MDFHAFGNSEMEACKAETKARWGSTKAYQEYEQKEKNGGDFWGAAQRMQDIFAQFGALRRLPPDSPEVQEKVSDLQKLIIGSYYTCTDEILYGLGQMYVQDERFRRNIDRAGGEGTADFVSQAIAVYCSRK